MCILMVILLEDRICPLISLTCLETKTLAIPIVYFMIVILFPVVGIATVLLVTMNLWVVIISGTVGVHPMMSKEGGSLLVKSLKLGRKNSNTFVTDLCIPTAVLVKPGSALGKHLFG